ncbi:hypothetical protein GQR36_03495 [Enterococcus termitis]
MKGNIQLLKVPEHDYSDYRYEVIFEAYKWDPQVEDANTVSEYVAVLDEHAVEELTNLAEQLALETTAMELELLDNLEYAKELGLPKSMCRGMKKAKDYQKEKHVRLMRFDFHPTDQGWQISEVNSDVPGGFAESSILPEIAARFFRIRNLQKILGDIYIKGLRNGFSQAALSVLFMLHRMQMIGKLCSLWEIILSLKAIVQSI